MRETAAQTTAKEKACDFVEDCLVAGMTFEDAVRAFKWAWVYVHDEKAYHARKAVEKQI